MHDYGYSEPCLRLQKYLPNLKHNQNASKVVLRLWEIRQNAYPHSLFGAVYGRQKHLHVAANRALKRAGSFV